MFKMVFSHNFSSIQIQTWWRITSREKCWYTPSSNSPIQFFPFFLHLWQEFILVIFSTSNGLQVSNVCISVAWYVRPNPNNSCIGLSWYVGPYPNKLQILSIFFSRSKLISCIQKVQTLYYTWSIIFILERGHSSVELNSWDVRLADWLRSL